MAKHKRLPVDEFGNPEFDPENVGGEIPEDVTFISKSEFEDPEGFGARVRQVNARIHAEARRLFGENPTPNQISLAASGLGLSGPGSIFTSGIVQPSLVRGVRLPDIDGQSGGFVLSPDQLLQATTIQANPEQLAQGLGIESLIRFEQLNDIDDSLWTEDDWIVFMENTGASAEDIMLLRSMI